MNDEIDEVIGSLYHRPFGDVVVIKSPRYTGGDFYVFVPVPTAPPAAAADSCSRDNFWTTFWISFIFGTIVGPDL